MGIPVGFADDLVDAVPLGPARRYLLGAGAAAVDEDDVGVLGFQLVELADDFSATSVASLPPATATKRSLRKMSGALAVLFRPLEVARLDDGGGQLAGLRDVRDPRRGRHTSPVSTR